MPLWFRIVRLWLPVMVVATALIGFSCLAIQQSYRNNADDHQVQIAEDIAARLDSGDTVGDLISTDSVNLSDSLAPFVVVYDASNQVIDGNGVLQGAQPIPPAGVLDTARAKGLNRLTWQPARGIRIASVSVATKDGRVVLAGRSLREAERRVADLGRIALLAWIATGLATLVAVALVELLGKRWDAAV